jgi:TRAP-type mannitol/chloroaromatic compound transport system permease small subunit
MMVPLGAFLILLQGLAKFIRDLTLVITGKEVVHEH